MPVLELCQKIVLVDELNGVCLSKNDLKELINLVGWNDGRLRVP